MAITERQIKAAAGVLSAAARDPGLLVGEMNIETVARMMLEAAEQALKPRHHVMAAATGIYESKKP